MMSFFIDTSTRISTIAILKDFDIIESMSIKCEKNLSNVLFSDIQNLFKKNNLMPNCIDKIYVSIGPGSFTGIRIGLTIAKTWATFCHIKLCPISSLEVLASANIEKSNTCVLIDARRNYVYGAIYDEFLNPIVSDSYFSIENLKNKAISISAPFFSNDQFDFDTKSAQKIDIVKLIKKHYNEAIVDSNLLNPKYLKLTEAEEKLKNE